MDFSLWMFFIALGVNGFIAYLAWNHGSVTTGGAVTGAVVGAGIMAGGGFWFWMILLFFFSSSTMFSSLAGEIKESLEKLHEKSDTRDTVQVLANGSVGCLSAVLYGITGHEIFAVVFAAAFCGAAADTWAGEVGVSSSRQPVSILTFKPVERGLSGGISAKGTLFAFFGSAAVGVLFFIQRMITYGAVNQSVVIVSLIAVTAGFLSSLVDSFLGAAVQVHYIDEHTGTVSEKKELSGRTLKQLRGVRWVNNDMVNFLSILFASAAAALLYAVLMG